MRNKLIISGILKIIFASLIVSYSFSVTGPSKGLSIWLGFVVAFPVFLWGILDFVKKNNTDEDDNDDC